VVESSGCLMLEQMDLYVNSQWE